ncbi:MAG: right-handed parallel beta-helix repeat-containing protein [Verrucomicrobia bacterium]|nr:right-handed parallel beta-helix repeat-containing protein [Verrucomicrobiota bacterium]
MRISRSVVAGMFLATVQWGSVQSETYYVDPLNGIDTNPGTIEQPWRTLQRAVKYGWPIEYRQPGDIVYLRGGLYSGQPHAIDINSVAGALSGSRTAPIVVKAYPGEMPVICDQLSPSRGVIIKNLTWWVFDGITYSNCYQSVWMESCTNVVWQNCTFGWMPQAGSGYAGLQFWGASQLNTVSNCTFIQWGQVTESCNDHGVSISIGAESTDEPMWYNLVVSNRFLYGGHDHFQLNTGYNVIRGNLFVNAPWMATNATCNTLPSIGGVPVQSNMYGAYGNRHTKPGDAGTQQIDMRNVWEGNTFLYTGPPPDDYGAFGIELGTRQSIYRFNTIAFSLAAGIFF